MAELVRLSAMVTRDPQTGLALPDAQGLTPSSRRTLAGVWSFRASAEAEAQLRFARLARELSEHDAPAEAVQLAHRAVDDERRHVALCAALAHRYSGATTAAAPQVASHAQPLGPKSLSPRDRVLYEVVAFCCITESLNTSLMKVCHDHARVPEARAAFRAILRDEVRHAKIGWAHLAAERARGRGAFLAELTPRMLSGAIKDELFTPAPSPAPGIRRELEAHGELDEPTRLVIFERAMRDVIVPGFRALNVDTSPLQDWLTRKTGREILEEGAPGY